MRDRATTSLRERRAVPRWIAASAAAVLLVSGSALRASDERSYSDAEIRARLDALRPTDEELRFSPPEGWPRAPLPRPSVLAVNAGEDRAAAARVVDGAAGTTWETRRTRPAPEVELVFPSPVTFNRAVVYNRFTTQRGTTVGNNALRTLELLVPGTGAGEDARSLGTFELGGPTAACFRRATGGQVCAYVDRREPDILILPRITTARVVLRLLRAHWSDDAREDWKTSVALSEVSFWDIPLFPPETTAASP